MIFRFVPLGKFPEIIIIIITLFESQIILAEHECCTNRGDCKSNKSNQIKSNVGFWGEGESGTSEKVGCVPFTWGNRLVDGLCKWKAKFPYWKFPFGVACTIWTTDPTYRKSLGRLWHLQNGDWNHCIPRDYRCFNWRRIYTSRSFSIMRKMENST